MRSKKKLKLRYLFLLLFILFFFKEINSQKKGQGTFFYNVFSYLVLPIKIVGIKTSTSLQNLQVYFVSKKKLQTENNKFKKEIFKLQWEKFLLFEYKQEAIRYKKLLNLKNLYPANYLVAQVIGRDLFFPYYSLVINKGSNHYLKKGMLVLSENSVVGKISFVGKNTSKVIPLQDPRSITSAYLGRSRNFGILLGNGKKCTLEYLPYLADIKLKDKVYTAGFSVFVPKGLYVGYVSKIIRKNPSLSPIVEVTPYDALHLAEEVLIITSTVNR